MLATIRKTFLVACAAVEIGERGRVRSTRVFELGAPFAFRRANAEMPSVEAIKAGLTEDQRGYKCDLGVSP